MKKRYFAIIFTLIIVMLAAVSCAPKSVEYSLANNYTLVRPDSGHEDVLDGFLLFNRTLSEKGGKVTITTDFLNERKGDTPARYELLFGPTNRPESETALAESSLSEFEFLVKPIGDKLVVLAGSRNAYKEAARYLADCFDATSQTLSLPGATYIGKWTPPLEALAIDGVSIGEFKIIADDIRDRELLESAEDIAELLVDLTGKHLEIASDESPESTHEIILCSSAVNRTLPEGREGIYTDGGKLYIHGKTPIEHEALIADFTAKFLTEESSILNITENELKGDFTMSNAAEKIIKVTNTAELVKAVAEANTLLKASAEAPVKLVIELDDGAYELTEALSIEKTSYSSLTFRAAEGAKPTITGAVSIPDSAWTRVEGKDYYVAKIDSELKVRDFFFDGKRIPIAVSDSYKTVTNFENPDKKDDPANAKGLYVHRELIEKVENLTYPTEFTIYVEWEFDRLHVTGVDMSDTKTVEGAELVRLKLDEEQLQFFSENNHGNLSIVNREYFLGNNVSFLKPGTCVADYKNGLVYYYPESGAPKSVSYSTLEQLISLKSASHIAFEGISFTGTGCLLSAEDGYMSGQANTEKREGVLKCAAVITDNCTDISFDKCSFTGLGTNGILSVNFLNGIKITNCRFDDVAMSAIALGNHSTTWDKNGANYNFVIENNLIENIGMEYPTATAIYISHVDGLKLKHNTIHNVAYSGISLGWGWSVVGYNYGESINVRGAELAYNHITDFMTKLKDGAAIYVLGANCTTEYTELFNEMHHNYAKNPNKLHRGYYLDGSASNWYVHDNVISGALYPLFTQFHVKDQYNHNIKSERIYSTDAIDKKNNAPDRNVILGEIFVEPTLEEIFAKYPEAKKIADEAGMKN